VVAIKTGCKVSDAMTEKPISVLPDKTIAECANVMLTQHVGSLLIMKGDVLHGIITEQDIVRKVIAENRSPQATTVGDAMITDMITISPDADIYDALVLMRDNNIRHLPVIHKKNLVGYLTIKDILKIQPQLFDMVVEKFELREEENKPIGFEKDASDVCDNCGIQTNRLKEMDGMMYCSMCWKNQSMVR
jgi:signal-transduction protein with cAMP-binding, CBS, and nucleotidyltransferase domain